MSPQKYKPKHLELWERPPNYIGKTYYDYYPVISVHRDSDVLERSNFRVAERTLQEVADSLPEDVWEEYGIEPGDALFVARARHWAVGWIDTLYVHKDSPPELLKAADELVASMKDYPVLDEDELSQLEMEELHATWEAYGFGEFVKEVAKSLAEEIEDTLGTELSISAKYELEDFVSEALAPKSEDILYEDFVSEGRTDGSTIYDIPEVAKKYVGELVEDAVKVLEDKGLLEEE